MFLSQLNSLKKEKKAQQYLGDSAVIVNTDLSSQESIRKLAEGVRNILASDGLDVLINNAGSFYSYYSLSDEGVEKQFTINTIAPFYLSLLLYDKLKMAGGRIVNVSSSSHYGAKIKRSDIQLSRNYGQLKLYKHSKFMAVMLSKRFHELSDSVKTYMTDTGLVNTEIGFKNTSGIAKFIWKRRKRKGRSPKREAETSIYLASEKTLPKGLYFKDCKLKKPNKSFYNKEYIERVWEYCQRVTGVNVKEIIIPYEE